MLQDSTWAQAAEVGRAWLGEAIAIKEPTADFRPRAANLLIVGQNEVAVLGILGTALVGLAAQYPRHGSRLPNVSALRPRRRRGGFPHTEFFEKLAPHCRTARCRPLARAGGHGDGLAQEVDRRQKENDTNAATIFVVVYACALPRPAAEEDDMASRGRRRDGPPGGAFAMLLREGPGRRRPHACSGVTA